MGFFQDLGDAITGKTKQEMAAAQMQAQMDAITLQADLEKAELEAKTSPEALEARTKQFRAAAITVVSVVMLLIIGRALKWW